MARFTLTLTREDGSYYGSVTVNEDLLCNVVGSLNDGAYVYGSRDGGDIPNRHLTALEEFFEGARLELYHSRTR